MEIFGIICAVVIVIIVIAMIISLLCIACETIKGKIISSIVVILAAILITVVVILSANESNKIWNNGYCECGGKWKLVAVCDSDHSSRTKYYICDECYKEITR